MMENLDIQTIAIFSAILLGSGASLAVLVVSRVLQNWQARCQSLEAGVAAMRREFELMASISLKTGRRVKRIEQEYAGVADRVELVELRGSAQSFDLAIAAARRGIDPGRLTQQFGLSLSEADLVSRLHGRKKTA